MRVKLAVFKINKKPDPIVRLFIVLSFYKLSLSSFQCLETQAAQCYRLVCNLAAYDSYRREMNCRIFQARNLYFHDTN